MMRKQIKYKIDKYSFKACKFLFILIAIKFPVFNKAIATVIQKTPVMVTFSSPEYLDENQKKKLD